MSDEDKIVAYLREVFPEMFGKKTRRCVECGKPCTGKVHVSCALFRMGEINIFQHRKMLRKEMEEYWWKKRRKLIHG